MRKGQREKERERGKERERERDRKKKGKIQRVVRTGERDKGVGWSW